MPHSHGMMTTQIVKHLQTKCSHDAMLEHLECILNYGVFTLDRTGTGTTTIGTIDSWFRCNMKASTQFHIVSRPCPGPGLAQLEYTINARNGNHHM